DDKNLTGPKIPYSEAVFARWTAIGALGPFMQLHGRGNFAPWTVPTNPDATVTRYRYWAKLHSKLVPFFYSLAAELKPVITPAGPQYQYALGDAFLVAPILDDT